MEIQTIEKEKYTEKELEDLAAGFYDETVTVLGMEMDALRIIKELDDVFYAELLERLQEYETKYICPNCEQEHDSEDDALECCDAGEDEQDDYDYSTQKNFD